MFKSIRYRISLTFILLVLCAQVVIGAVVAFSSMYSYHKSFARTIEATFNEETIGNLTETAKTINVEPTGETDEGIIITETDTDNGEALKNAVLDTPLFKENPGLTLAILNGDGEIKYSSVNPELVAESETAKSAIAGEVTMENGILTSNAEYALPLKNGDAVSYVVYVKDPMTAQMQVIGRLVLIFSISLPLSALLAYVFASLFAKSVSAPLKELSVNAKKLADGDTSALSPAQGKDEISELTNALLYLSNSKRAHADEANSEKTRLEAILQNMSDGIMAFDTDGKLTHINPVAMRLLNRKFVDDITFNKFFKEINGDITLESLHYLPTDDVTERQVTINEHVLQLSFARVMQGTNDGGVIVIIHDITKHEKLERARRDFVANVSHELRTPITVIKSYSDILADTPDADTDTRVRFLNTISSETDRMAKIISDLLTLSSLDENTAYKRPSETIDVRSMIEGLVERLSLSAKKKEQSLLYTPINDVPKIKGDRDALERVLTNVISNALKYTPTGGKIQIYTSNVYNDILIKVSDTGIGIPKEQLPNIFERFYRVDKARSRDKGGTGLGLAIAKQTIESSFHGKITISSELNKGTDVLISIPIKKK